jgi:hypothetical protein
MNATAVNYHHMMKSFEEYMLDEAVGARPKEKKSVIKVDKRKTKSLDKFKTSANRNKLLLF